MDNDEETNGDDVTAEDIDEGETTHEVCFFFIMIIYFM